MKGRWQTHHCIDSDIHSENKHTNQNKQIPTKYRKNGSQEVPYPTIFSPSKVLQNYCTAPITTVKRSRNTNHVYNGLATLRSTHIGIYQPMLPTSSWIEESGHSIWFEIHDIGATRSNWLRFSHYLRPVLLVPSSINSDILGQPRWRITGQTNN